MYHDKLMMRIGELGKLTDVLSDFETKDVFTDNDRLELYEQALLLIDEYLMGNIFAFNSPYFMEVLTDNIHSFMALHFENMYCEEIEEELHIVISEACKTYFTHVMPRRSYKTTFTREKQDKNKLEKRLTELRSKPQPDQRTNEWYIRRHNMITASIAWKGLDSESYVNSLIYEKCKPLNVEKYGYVNTETPFHWGTKFEPVSILIYEKKYGTKVDEFGCIPDEEHSFIGVSPDGINVKKESSRYGRMLEVKNRVSDAVPITGIPKKEYWIQMQMQMGACKLNECDFLETKFDAYESRDDFYKDGTFNESEDGKMKGIFMYFIKDGKPHYEYPEVGLSEEEFTKWEEAKIEEHKELTWIQNIYWKLDKYSCVLVVRNKTWYEKAVEKLGEVWNIILKERETGYQHRAPNRRERKISETPKEVKNPICLLNINKLVSAQSPPPEKGPDDEIENYKIIKVNMETN